MSSPLNGVTSETLESACTCLLKQRGAAIPKIPAKETPICVPKYQKALQRAFSAPSQFCNFFQSGCYTTSPVLGLTAAQVMEGCYCFHGSSATSTSTSKLTASPTSQSGASPITTKTMTTTQAPTTSPRNTTCALGPTTFTPITLEAPEMSLYLVTYSLQEHGYNSIVSAPTTQTVVTFGETMALAEAASACTEMAWYYLESAYPILSSANLYSVGHEWHCVLLPWTEDFIWTKSTNASIECSYFYYQTVNVVPV
ncbi:hypothetical protein ANO11243_049550 [Dothideomycetidae sp. 11243]|nr:hypothetical protein ANO11243_049550 [fungal sp. No.11243]